MTKEQKLYIEVKKLNEIIDTPSDVFQENMAKHLEETYNANTGIPIPALLSGIDYKMSAIKLCARSLREIISV